LAAQSLTPDAVNLLQGEFAVGPQIDFDLDRLKPSAMLAGAALVLWLATTLLTWMSWRSEARRLEAEMNDAFATAFPGTPLVDARAQLRQKLLAGASPATPATLSPLLNLAGKVPRPLGAKLVAMDYHLGQLDVTYEVEADKLETVQASLASAGAVSRPAPGRLTLSLKS
jgi:type II secretion system protein L